MQPHTHGVEVDPRIVRMVRHRACRLVGRVGFTPDDREDIEQELWLDLWTRLPHFDPARSCLYTFAARLADNKAASMVEARLAQARRDRHCRESLDEMMAPDGGDSGHRRRDISEDEYLRRTGRQSRPAAELRDLRLDVARVLTGVSGELRTLAELLSAEDPVAAARRSAISRMTMYRRRRQLRHVFERAGLGTPRQRGAR